MKQATLAKDMGWFSCQEPQYEEKGLLSASRLMLWLYSLGLIPKRTRGVIIYADCEEALRLYIDAFGTSEMVGEGPNDGEVNLPKEIARSQQNETNYARILGKGFIDHLYKLGVVPEFTRRVVVSANVDDVLVQVFVETFGTDSMLQVSFPTPQDTPLSEIKAAQVCTVPKAKLDRRDLVRLLAEKKDNQTG